MLRLTHAFTQNGDRNNATKLLAAIWALRLAATTPLKPTNTSSIINVSWLKLIGDFIEWPIADLSLWLSLSNEPSFNDSIDSEYTACQLVPMDWHNVYRHFVMRYLHNPERYRALFVRSIHKLERQWRAIADQDIYWVNIQLLSDLLDLNELERMYLVFLITIERYEPLDDYLKELEAESFIDVINHFAAMFACSHDDFNSVFHKKGRLMSNGLICRGLGFLGWHHFLNLNVRLRNVCSYPNQDLNELMINFMHEPLPGRLCREDMPHLEDAMQLLIHVLGNALAQRQTGVNILLYGVPGTGKTEFAKLLADQVGAKLYEVIYSEIDGESISDHERYLSYVMAQKFLSGRTDSLLLFDEMPTLLGQGANPDPFDLDNDRSQRGSFSKAWLNQLLESNPIPTVWICNDHSLIDAAHLRRFLFHLEFRVPPRSVRKRIAVRYFQQFKLSHAAIDQLSQTAELSPAQLESVARLLQLSGCHERLETEKYLSLALRQSLAARGQIADKQTSHSITPYRLDYLNVDCAVPLERLVESLKLRHDANICFYGPPGAGKTQLVSYFAEQLDRPLIIKRASDLISKWLGETEHNIAHMFRQAKDEQAILFLDEADSFLRERQALSASWEVTQVNELLKQMECFDGIFICATNLFNRLDPAALRRFAFKLRFDYLKPQQRLDLFAESVGLSRGFVQDCHHQRLQQLDHLTPGDFATVLWQVNALGESPSAEFFLEQLERECEMKEGGRVKRSIGFV